MSKLGINRERQVRRKLEEDDYWVCRAAGSLGDADLVALKDGRRPLMVEVKATAAGPYSGFSPKDRADILFAARLAGADATLAWWPSRGKLKWIPSAEWPKVDLCNKCGGRLVAVKSGAVVDVVRCTKCPREVPASAMRRAA